MTSELPQPKVAEATEVLSGYIASGANNSLTQRTGESPARDRRCRGEAGPFRVPWADLALTLGLEIPETQDLKWRT